LDESAGSICLLIISGIIHLAEEHGLELCVTIDNTEIEVVPTRWGNEIGPEQTRVNVTVALFVWGIPSDEQLEAIHIFAVSQNRVDIQAVHSTRLP
jgi:hypothetical protein